ncbi:MAG: energy-coupling factor transporter ATPase [Coriobacteriaceae bacterium]|jgi:energy-coupling factor transport system ATP-binding protein|nr:energy-coupling factor transporter ATPase [Coriobacteriaceae bacterium]
MPIVFEGVSYSYTAPAKPKDAKKPRIKAKEASIPGERPAWGNAPDALWAIHDIDFTLEDGDFLGIAGHTGSGKSTLIQHMNGLIHPTLGRVLIDGTDIADKKAASRIRGKVGLVFQYPEHQLFAANVYDDVAFGPRNLGLPPDEVDRCVRDALAQVSLDFDSLRTASPFELSGGQQRRVAFAGVLAMRPSTLILDEPVAGLDPATRNSFLNLIAELHRQGLTVVLVSHNMNDLARLCNRVLVLKEGQQFALGSPQEVFAHADELKAIGLGVPSAQGLANRLVAQGVPLGDISAALSPRRTAANPEGATKRLYDIESLADELAALYKAQPAAGAIQPEETVHEGQAGGPYA